MYLLLLYYHHALSYQILKTLEANPRFFFLMLNKRFESTFADMSSIMSGKEATETVCHISI